MLDVIAAEPQNADFRCMAANLHADLEQVPLPNLSDTMYLSMSFRKSTPPENRQLNVSISNSKQLVDDCVGKVTF